MSDFSLSLSDFQVSLERASLGHAVPWVGKTKVTTKVVNRDVSCGIRLEKDRRAVAI